MYNYKETSDKRFILSVNNHEEISEALAAFCRQMDIRSGIVGGIAAISQATFRFLDPATKQYVDKTFDEQMEITCLTGNISRKDDEPYLHLHVTASRRDYTCIGGHLLTARVNGACELFIEDYGLEGIGRKFDPETGLNLYDFK
jgi:predicted DNA-binding protein with PD1-like motif